MAALADVARPVALAVWTGPKADQPAMTATVAAAPNAALAAEMSKGFRFGPHESGRRVAVW